MKAELLQWLDDGLPMLRSGIWTQEKYSVLFNYMQMFTTGMKNIWNERVYVDLYSGPGCCYIEDSKKIVKGSPLLALSVKDPFDKYVFCEKEKENLDALRDRVRRINAERQVKFIDGDCNVKAKEIIDEIPQPSTSYKVLTFCFVDPFDLGIQFKTIEALAIARRVDFLVLLALFMDGNRNEKHYTNPNNSKVDLFLDSFDWRNRWVRYKERDDSFPRFLANEFENKMLSLGSLKSNVKNTREFRSSERNLPLYHLAFFSRNERGYDFWKKGTSYSHPQISMDFKS